MQDQFARTRLLLGEEKIEKLRHARVAIFGLGGVGGFVVEALVRSGVGHLELIDNDQVCLSNLNRQIIATRDTIGKFKVDVMEERILSINPDARVHKRRCFYLPETAAQFHFPDYDYMVDAVDTVTAKIDLVLQAQIANVPVMSSMGTGNKLDPTRLEVADIYSTSICPLAKVMRKELKRRGVKKLKVVYSKEPVIKPIEAASSHGTSPLKPERHQVPGSTAFVPSVAGLIIAGEIIKDLVDMGV